MEQMEESELRLLQSIWLLEDALVEIRKEVLALRLQVFSKED